MRLGTAGSAQQAAKDCCFRPGSERVVGRGLDARSRRGAGVVPHTIGCHLALASVQNGNNLSLMHATRRRSGTVGARQSCGTALSLVGHEIVPGQFPFSSVAVAPPEAGRAAGSASKERPDQAQPEPRRNSACLRRLQIGCFVVADPKDRCGHRPRAELGPARRRRAGWQTRA
jgi:hypothetical protein